MDYDTAFEKLKEFLETQPASTNAIRHLDSKAEIRLLIDNQLECKLYNDKGSPRLEKAKSERPDVEFIIAPESIRLLDNVSGDNMAQFGIEVIKEIVSGDIQVRLCSSIRRLMSGGYLKIIKEAGPEFAQYLASYGFKSMTKIISLVQSLRR